MYSSSSTLPSPREICRCLCEIEKRRPSPHCSSRHVGICSSTDGLANLLVLCSAVFTSLDHYILYCVHCEIYSACCFCCSVGELCPTLCDPMEPLGEPTRICPWGSQARVLELVAISSPGYLPNPGIESTSPACQEGSLPLGHLGGPTNTLYVCTSAYHCTLRSLSLT